MTRRTVFLLETLLVVSLAGCSGHSDATWDAQKKDAEGVKNCFKGSTKTLRDFELPDTQKPGPAKDQNPTAEKRKGKER
jgi:hypothetical protein